MAKGVDLILFAGTREDEAYIAFGSSIAFRTDPIVIVPWEHFSAPGRPLAWWHCDDWEALMVSLKRASDPEQLQAMVRVAIRSEEHTSELQSLMRSSYSVSCLNNTNTQ